MRLILAPIIFCAFSLLVAKGITSALVYFAAISSAQGGDTHTVVMLIMLAFFLALPRKYKE